MVAVYFMRRKVVALPPQAPHVVIAALATIATVAAQYGSTMKMSMLLGATLQVEAIQVLHPHPFQR